MGLGIELRVPYLDRRLVEFALSIDESFHIDSLGTSKSLFRHAVSDEVPNLIAASKRKTSFEEAPFDPEDIYKWAAAEITGNEEFAKELDFLRFTSQSRAELEKELRKSGKDFSWRLLVTFLWARIFLPLGAQS
jgi:asparagine synthetase B (glutamine-hydrolysing)